MFTFCVNTLSGMPDALGLQADSELLEGFVAAVGLPGWRKGPKTGVGWKRWSVHPGLHVLSWLEQCYDDYDLAGCI
jgi:hypothetical protein